LREPGEGRRLLVNQAFSKYHQRRAEQSITSRAEQLEIIRRQKIMTVAMCRQGEPYLVTLDYGFDEQENCFYAHCSKVGKKIDFLRSNPLVSGQVLEDRGYVEGRCLHAFRCVICFGTAVFVEEETEKRLALELMMDHLEPDPGPLKKRLTSEALQGAAVLRFRVRNMTAKRDSISPEAG
jgi:nitroimidazol reductase NimA-like FMN-containing flavoprotein (pyridoxamine 5'-phosphate oxidase superfamily)